MDVHELPADPAFRARRLFAGIADEYDLLAELLSFGQNGRWRRFLVSCVPPPRDRVLDVATGTASVARALAQQGHPAVIGLDQSGEMLRVGARKLARTGPRRQIVLVRGDARRLPFLDASFDAVTFTYLLRYVEHPAATMAELARVVRPGGTLAGLEFHVPEARPLRAAWWLYTRLGLPLAGRIVSRGWYDVGQFLGPSISAFYRCYPLTEQLTWWRAAGITDVQARVMSVGGGVVIWGSKEG